MKNFLLLGLACAAALAAATPQALAYDQNPWHDIDHIAPNLNHTFSDLVGERDRLGENPQIHNQLAQLHFRLDHFNGMVRQRAGDPSLVRKEGENIGNLEQQVAAEYRAYKHEPHVHRIY